MWDDLVHQLISSSRFKSSALPLCLEKIKILGTQVNTLPLRPRPQSAWAWSDASPVCAVGNREVTGKGEVAAFLWECFPEQQRSPAGSGTSRTR